MAMDAKDFGQLLKDYPEMLDDRKSLQPSCGMSTPAKREMSPDPLIQQQSIVAEIESRLSVCDSVERTMDTARNRLKPCGRTF